MVVCIKRYSIRIAATDYKPFVAFSVSAACFLAVGLVIADRAQNPEVGGVEGEVGPGANGLDVIDAGLAGAADVASADGAVEAGAQ